MFDKTNLIGSFDVTSGKLNVSDPCYKPGTWCSCQVDVENGRWNAYMPRSADGLPEMLAAFLDGHDDLSTTEEKVFDGAGVDSGQMSIWDASDYTNADARYDEICMGTLSPNRFHIGGHGAASSTKYGDGAYPVFAYRDDNGAVVGVSVDFAPEDD